MPQLPIRERFKKFSGEFIPDIVTYIKDIISKNPNLTISVGCDSMQRKRKTLYTVTVMLYNGSIKNGAHVVFFRENILKVRDNFERLHKEVEYVHTVGELLTSELEGIYNRRDLDLFERKRYKFHLSKCDGELKHISSFDETNFINSIQLTDFEKVQEFKLVDLHVDLNPSEGDIDKKGVQKNRSNIAYKSFVPWLRGLGYRVFAKPMSYASSSAADILLRN